MNLVIFLRICSIFLVPDLTCVLYDFRKTLKIVFKTSESLEIKVVDFIAFAEAGCWCPFLSLKSRIKYSLSYCFSWKPGKFFERFLLFSMGFKWVLSKFSKISELVGLSTWDVDQIPYLQKDFVKFGQDNSFWYVLKWLSTVVCHRWSFAYSNWWTDGRR